jgi:hypothetical protein
MASNTRKKYVVDGLGLFPRYRRTTLVEARSFAQIYTILDGETYQVLDQLLSSTMILKSTTVTHSSQRRVKMVSSDGYIESYIT